MSRRRLWVPHEVASLIRGFHPDIKRKIKAGLSEILAAPECGKPLRDELKGLRSMKAGRFRIIYRVGKHSMEIIAVGPRRVIYKETYRLLKKT